MLYKFSVRLISLGLVLLLSLGTTLALTAQEPPDYSQAPSLAAQVEAGELPPVEERLPVTPLVIDGVDGIGEYGGIFRRLAARPNDSPNYVRVMGYEPLVQWTPDGTDVRANVAESWEVNEDGTEYVLFLREGMKWSDGEPFTSADILFWYEDVLLNEELTPGLPGWMSPGGEVGVVTAPDETTVVFSFSEPNGLFLRHLAIPDNGGLDVTFFARHYFEQFHINYNENVVAEAEAAGFESWTQYFEEFAGGNAQENFAVRWNPNVPSIGAWVIEDEITADTSILSFVRNPYYWKVDSAGNQYPYFDEVRFTVQSNSETRLISAASGGVDMQVRYFTSITDRPFLFDNQESGGYSFFSVQSVQHSYALLHVNQTIEDPGLNEFFNNHTVRVALSHAINRQEIVDLFFVGLSEPIQPAPLDSTPYYNETLATQHLEYDVERASQLLDEAGYGERDGDGFRVDADGNRLSIVLVINQAIPNHAEIGNLVAEYWQEIGLEVLTRVVERSQYNELIANNEHGVAMWNGAGGIDVIEDPRTFFPFSSESYYATRWAAYYRNFWGTGEEPSEEDFAQRPTDERIIRQWELYDELQITVDPGQQVEIMSEILSITQEVFPVIGLIKTPLQTGIVTNEMRNVPDQLISGWTYATPANALPFTYWKAE